MSIDPNDLREMYKAFVEHKYDSLEKDWPIIHGFAFNVLIGEFKDYSIFIFKPGTGTKQMIGIGTVSERVIGFDHISDQNIDAVRLNLEGHYPVNPNDLVFIVKDDLGNLPNEFEFAIQKQEKYLGFASMKVFLSHKGVDKPKVREFKQVLESLGFQPWLDEDAMAAGVELERSLLKGMKESCAAIFFVTSNYVDEGYLATEVNYALAEKRAKKDNFSLITLVFNTNGQRGNVPDLLKTYVWKEPESDLQALIEIINAMPIKLKGICWKK